MISLKRKFKKLLQLIGYFLINSGKPDSPFVRTEGTEDVFKKLSVEASHETYEEVKKYEDLSGSAIDKEWLKELALHTQIVIKRSKLCYAHGRVLYAALSRYLSSTNKTNEDGVTIIETGTARGFSSLCMAKALSDHNRTGKILTFDLIPNDELMYWNCIDDLDGMKTRLDLLNPWKNLVDNFIIFIEGNTRETLKSISTGRVNFAFLDGAHTYDDVMFEFFQIKDKQLPGDVIVYDDYSSKLFPGIVKAVDYICSDFGYDRMDIISEEERIYVVATKK